MIRIAFTLFLISFTFTASSDSELDVYRNVQRTIGSSTGLVPESEITVREQICAHDIEDHRPRQRRRRRSRGDSYSTSTVQGLTSEEYWHGNEYSCLQEAGLLLDEDTLNPDHITQASDFTRFVNQCTFLRNRGNATARDLITDSISDINDILVGYHLPNRDNLMNAFWQDLARRSENQFSCRRDVINHSIGDADAKARLHGAARRVFESVVDDVREMLFYKRLVAGEERLRVDTTMRSQAGGCGGPASSLFHGLMAWAANVETEGDDICDTIEEGRTRIREAEYEQAIAAKFSAVPFGYEPAVVLALTQMADSSGEFDPVAYENALRTVEGNYAEQSEYYRDRFVERSEGVGNYCIDEEFKELAAQTGVVDKLLSAQLQNGLLDQEQATILQCKLNSKYKVAPRVGRQRRAIFLAAGTLAAGIAFALPSGGSSYALAVGAIGLTAYSFQEQVSIAYQACMRKDFQINAGNGNSECDVTEELDSEISQFSMRECLTEVGFTALETIPFGMAGSALVKARRGVPVADVVREFNEGAARLTWGQPLRFGNDVPNVFNNQARVASIVESLTSDGVDIASGVFRLSDRQARRLNDEEQLVVFSRVLFPDGDRAITSAQAERLEQLLDQAKRDNFSQAELERGLNSLLNDIGISSSDLAWVRADVLNSGLFGSRFSGSVEDVSRNPLIVVTAKREETPTIIPEPEEFTGISDSRFIELPESEQLIVIRGEFQDQFADLPSNEIDALSREILAAKRSGVSDSQISDIIRGGNRCGR
ncbi:MAG: hypothetical protein CME65_12770 [Halobacteriovoraceae bacterium]|nr:hypothetical protein [Halobacteriovoraceae bacterium]